MKRIVIVGGTGYIGNELGIKLTHAGYDLAVVTRDPSRYQRRLAFPCELLPYDGVSIKPELLQGAHGVINLAGASIAEGRWTPQRKEILRSSRTLTTRAVVNAINQCSEKPKVLIQASAIGANAEGFLKELCDLWEAEFKPLDSAVRLVVPRMGLVTGWGGGAFAKLNNIYAAGLGASLGSGNQWMNVIHLDDLLTFFLESLKDETYTGIYDLVSPDNCTMKQAHQTMARLYPSLQMMWAPGLALKVIMGEAAQLILAGPNVSPKRLVERNFPFAYPHHDNMIEQLNGERERPFLLQLTQKQWIPAPAESIWEFFSAEKNLEAMTPPWLSFHVEGKSTPEIGRGTEIDYRLKLHGIPFKWRTLIDIWEENTRFRDTQIKGPYNSWYHVHEFSPLKGGTLMVDKVDFKLPVFPLSSVAVPFVTSDVEKIFAYRKQVVAEWGF